MSRRNGGTLGLGGWQVAHAARRAGGFVQQEAQPTSWERLLERLELSAEGAARVCAREAHGADTAAIRRWVERNRMRRYVPEEILVALGLAIEEERGLFVNSKRFRDEAVEA